MEFKKYVKNGITEMIEYRNNELYPADFWNKVSISKEDRKNGSPKNGDMIARNPDNHNDVWLVAKEYFEKNYREFSTDLNIETTDGINKLIKDSYDKRSCDISKISDTYHTFGELYEFRKLYNALLFNEWAKQSKYNVHKSLRHSDGNYCFNSDGKWFIVVAQLPTGQISNHYPIEDWDLFQIPERNNASEFDGHTPQDVLFRLEDLSKQKPESDFIERMIIEEGELKFKLTKLIDFIENNPLFNNLSYQEKQLLLEQRVFMSKYRQTLNLRIQFAKGEMLVSN